MEDLTNLVPSDDKELFKIIGPADDSTIEKISVAPYSFWRSAFKELFKNKVALICCGLIFLVVLFAIIGPMLHYEDVYKYYVAEDNRFYLLPSAEHWFGTNSAGTDIWSAIWVGSRISLVLATVVALINTVLGLVVGSLWGFFKKLDPIMIELRNFINNVPSLLLDILFLQAFSLLRNPDGTQMIPDFWRIVIVLCIFGWLGLASFLRNQIIIIRNREFNVASVTLGSRSGAIIKHNLLPYLVSVIVTVCSTSIPDVIAAEVSLSFFRLGFDPLKTMNLGYVLTESTTSNSDWKTYPHVMLFPTAIILVLTIAFFYLGLAFADATDPKNHI